MVYLIQVGNYSRRQSFIKLHEKAVLIDDKYTKYEIDKYFQGKYEGFSVIVTPIKEVKPVNDIPRQSNEDEWAQKLPDRVSVIRNFKIKYTDVEKKLHDEWEKSKRDTERALRELHSLIEIRYAKLFYSNFDQGEGQFELETNTFGTRCKNFPVNAGLFIEAAKECNGSVPEEPAPPEHPDNNPADEAKTEEPLFPDDVPF
jgi:hypothetical protein